MRGNVIHRGRGGRGGEGGEGEGGGGGGGDFFTVSNIVKYRIY